MSAWDIEGQKRLHEIINERIEALEKKYKDLEDMQETIVESDPVRMQGQIAELKGLIHVTNNKLGEYTLKHNGLEKNFDTRITTIGLGHEGDIKDIDEQIAEMERNLNAFVKDTGSTFFDVGKEIAELKEPIELLKKFQQGYIDRIINLEEVLRDHLESHKVVAREQLTDKDKIIIFKEFDDAIIRQLEKLDVARQTVKTYNDLPQAEKERRWKELKKREVEGYPMIVPIKMEKKEEYFGKQIRLGNIPKYKEDSGGEKEVKEAGVGSGQTEAMTKLTPLREMTSSKLPELILNDPCQPCEEDIECDECDHAHPELDICKCQHERANHKRGIGECWCGCKSFKLDTFSGIPKEKLPEPKFLEGNCIYKMECENVSETCHLECGRYHKFDLREFIDVAYNLAQPKTETEKSDALDALLHAVAPIPLPEVSKLLKETEERVRGTTRKELIEEFAQKLMEGYKNHFTIKAFDKFEKYKYAYQSLQEWVEKTIKDYGGSVNR